MRPDRPGPGPDPQDERREARRREPPNLVGVRLAPHGRTLEYDAGELRLEAGTR